MAIRRRHTRVIKAKVGYKTVNVKASKCIKKRKKK